MSPDHLAQLRSDGDLLVAAAGTADLDATVPGLDWDARTVALHTGAVHRWAADIVRRALPSNETGGSTAFWPASPVPDAKLPAWLAVGLDDLVAVLDAAPEDLQCFTLVPGSSARKFWHRRQAHETAVHRADLEAVVGRVSEVPADFAQDGLAELVGGFALEPGFATPEIGSLLLQAYDGPAWRIAFGPDGNRVSTGAADALAPADATVRGRSTDLYLWAWNRPAVVQVSGNPRSVDLWRGVRVR